MGLCFSCARDFQKVGRPGNLLLLSVRPSVRHSATPAKRSPTRQFLVRYSTIELKKLAGHADSTRGRAPLPLLSAECRVYCTTGPAFADKGEGCGIAGLTP